MPVRYKYRRHQRLRTRRDFDRVFARKCSVADALLVVYADTNDLQVTRLGMRIGKRTGGAVVRFRIKRLIREAFRLSQHELPAGLDLVCIARRPPVDAKLDGYQASLRRLAERAHRKLQRGLSAS